MGRLLCLDVGDRRIGVALSDESRMIASPHSVIERVGWGPDVRRIRAVFDESHADAVVVGLPLNMDGSEGFQAAKVRQFAQQVEKAGMPVLFQDERLSTVTAEEALLEGGLSRQDRKTRVDMVAAAVILEEYLRRAAAAEDGLKKRQNAEEDKNDGSI